MSTSVETFRAVCTDEQPTDRMNILFRNLRGYRPSALDQAEDAQTIMNFFQFIVEEQKEKLEITSNQGVRIRNLFRG